MMMKKLIKIFAFLTLITGMAATEASAQNRFYVNPSALEPGKTGTLEFLLDNTDPFYGLQAEITLPAGVSPIKDDNGKARFALTGRFDSTYSVTSNIKNGIIYIGVFSSSATPEPISGADGAILTLEVSAAETFKGGDALISGIRFVDPTDNDVKLSPTSSPIGVLPVSIKINPSSIGFEIKEGNELEKELSVTFNPTWTTEKTLTWTTSDSDVATVDANGKVSVVYKGKATITATTVNGKTATCYVSVGKPVTSVEMEPSAATIMDSETLSVIATPLPLDADNRDFVRWESSDESIATVDENGLVTAKSAGEVEISALCGSAVGICTVTVIPTPAESVSILPESAEMRIGESVTLTATVLPEVTTDKTVTWSSSDESIATVDAEGTVTGVSVGEVTITVSTVNGKTATCPVKVNPILAESITLSAESVKLKVGEAATLTATVLPENTTFKTLTWSSGDDAIATVDADGTVTGVALGEVTVTAMCDGVTAECKVTVVPTPAESLTLEPETAELNVGESLTLIAIVLPEDATYKTPEWISSDPSIASVDADGVVTALSRGTVTITATLVDGQTATCEVTVYAPAKGITLDPTEMTLEKGTTGTITATIDPVDTTDELVWSSADESIATVDDRGVVTAVAPGTAVITARCGEQEAECAVTVIISPTELILDPTEVELLVTEQTSLTATVFPEDTTDKTVTWTSSNPSIASVDADGVVTALYKGTVTITATTANGLTATCEVTVYSPAKVITLNPTEMTLEKGTTGTITATVDPVDTSDEVVWTSADESIATVERGIVTAIATGTVAITARCGEVEAECTVTVISSPSTILLDREEVTLMIDDQTTLIATVLPEDATDKNVTWKSSDEAIATVDQNGTITAIALGEAVITAMCGDATAACKVWVVPTPAESIELSRYTVELRVGGTFNVIATVLPDDTTDPTVTWISSDPSIATVDQGGNITAIALGEATVTASCGDVYAECIVTVVRTPVTSISLTNSDLVIKVGKTAEIAAIVLPADATDKSVTWATSDPSVATVDPYGNVTGITPGTATVTTTSVSDPDVSAQCNVTVETAITAVGGISLDRNTLTMTEGDNDTLIATVTPDNATDKTVTWESSDPTVATVSPNGDVIAVSPGTAVIYASSSNGMTAECAVTVLAKVIYPTGISLSNSEMLMYEGDIADLIAIVRPADATDPTITWTSSNEAVATVDQSGNVTAVHLGTATISASTVNGFQANCFVTVIPKIIAVEKIELDRDSLFLEKGDFFTLTATITPDDATDKTVTWKSSDPTIATVGPDGTVTGIAVGVATVYASSSNGLTAECVVTVTPGYVAPESISLSNTELLMREGHTADLIAIVRPDEATDKSVTWTSSDESIATVDENGIVTAIRQGVTVVSATTVNGLQAFCTVTVVPDFIPVEKIELDRDTVDMLRGDIDKLIATITPDNATDKTVTWKSSDKAVVTVTQDGEITAEGVGTAKIYASSSNGMTAECVVNVTLGIVDPESISLSNTEMLMYEGHTADLIAIVRPDEATDKTVIWKSSDSSVATVDENGIVTAVRQGVTVVSATTVNGLTATCEVTVIPEVIPVESITLDRDTVDMIKGDVDKLIATITPDNATDKTVTWKSSDTAVVTVDQNGEITAEGVGTAKIYASTSNGLTAECVVNVSLGIVDPESISLSNYELLMRVGRTTNLIAIVRPDEATDKSVTWASSDESVATVNDNGDVTALKIGVTDVTATTVNGLTATCKVTVEPDIIAVEKITLNRDTIELVKADTFTLIATVLPEDATDKSVTWASSDRAIATVTQDGLVTAEGVGTAKIYASSSNGLTAECVVIVTPGVVAPESITLSNSELLMYEGHTADLIAIVRPEETTDKTVTWASSDEAIATVDANGLVTAIRQGKTVVSATTVNGLTATCDVTVIPEVIAVEKITLNRDTIELVKADTFTLIATITPDNATDRTVTWRSSDLAIATVSQTGLVTAEGVGTTKVLASSSNGLTVECVVIVKQGEVAPESITLSNYELTLREGRTADLIAIVRPEETTDKTVTWASSDEAIATVDANGLVTAVKQGKAVVSATTVNGLKANCDVTVIPDIIAVEKITLNRDTIELVKADTFTLVATIIPENATDKTVTWRSADRAIATVSETGLVTAVGVGTTKVLASSSNGLTAECVVIVTPGVVDPTGITLSNYELLMREGYTADLIAIVLPADATDKSVTWTSSDVSIASVDDKGLVTAVRQGVCIVTATTVNGLKATCTVTVVPVVIPVASIDVTPKMLDLMEGETFPLTATVTPDDATDRTVTWKSSDRAVATVSEDGVVTATGAGQAVIYVSSSNGLTVECHVTVHSRPLTPRKLLKKGNGTTSTFVILMDIPDAQLAELGYRFVYGFTDPRGESAVIGETSLRYCHTTPDIFNNPDYDFWAFAFIEDAAGNIVNSNLRHLDGSEEVCYDVSEYGYGSRSGIGTIAGDEWVRVTDTALELSLTGAGDKSVAVFNVSGMTVYYKTYASGTAVRDVVDLARFASGAYIVAFDCDGVVRTMKIVVR